MKLQQVRFFCRWRDASGREHYAETLFKLGLGPCGKVATHLDCGIVGEGHCFQVVQTCSDGEAKRFTYRMADVVGRIEETHGED